MMEQLLIKEENEMKDFLKKCEKDIFNIKLSEMYKLVFYYHKEGRLGMLRFPKRLRDLYSKATGNFGSKGLINSKLIDILNNSTLEYSDIKLIDSVNGNYVKGGKSE